jgi:hypothetical protein
VSVKEIVDARTDSKRHMEYLEDLYQITFSFGRTDGNKQLREALKAAIESLANDHRRNLEKKKLEHEQQITCNGGS